VPAPPLAAARVALRGAQGTDRLGTWQQEQRLIAPDRAAAVGGPPEVVRAWLIATTFAQRGEGRASCADVHLVDGDVVVPVI
jgi:hypothetical protein